MVLEGFTSGGQQRTAGRDLEDHQPAVGPRLRARHPLDARRTADGRRDSYHSNDYSNYLGTYTFASLFASASGTPRSYTQRIGDPNIATTTFQARLYVQDDIRVRKNLTLSPGVRYEAQTHLSD